MDADVLVEQYEHVLRRAKAMLRDDPDRAADLVHDAYLHILETTPSGIRKPREFMATAVTRKILDYLRKAQREQQWITFNSEDPALGAETRPEGPVKDLSDDLEAQDRLHHMFKGFQPHLTEVLLLCRRDGLTCKEAAVKLGLPTETVRKHLAAALARSRVMDKRYRHGGNPP